MLFGSKPFCSLTGVAAEYTHLGSVQSVTPTPFDSHKGMQWSVPRCFSRLGPWHCDLCIRWCLGKYLEPTHHTGGYALRPGWQVTPGRIWCPSRGKVDATEPGAGWMALDGLGVPQVSEFQSLIITGSWLEVGLEKTNFPMKSCGFLQQIQKFSGP